ncbi:DUF3626 domain-containing protein [Hymenobacter sp. 15J16-1T3B]|uniref:DUF3626 domain-containing protein n=1 Tax=Hymenobacter sp. 15J16-1T3B TaxID=2886941 RepID=UPI001D100234|nr:DUF3626 domain-containing protein [Hymenobacter sp. 15J16-1T3B]MCC3160147.1 DUF3626 domain-containing protein [Hymenobacter sp. 15J16-1T3B]
MKNEHETPVLNAARTGETHPEAVQRCPSDTLALPPTPVADVNASPAPALESQLLPHVRLHVEQQAKHWDLAVRGKLQSLTTPQALADDLARAAANVRRILAMAQPQLRIGNALPLAHQQQVLRQILNVQRLQTQFETQTSGGAYAPHVRAELEAELFGYDLELDPRLRPVYGYLTTVGYEPAEVEQYGRFALRLRPHMLSRTTLSITDTLDRAVVPAAYTNLPVTALIPNVSGYVRCFLGRMVTATTMQELEFRYVEAQYHGGVGLADIDCLLTKQLQDVPPDVCDRCRAAGIDVREFGT